MNELDGQGLYATAAELLRARGIHLPQWAKLGSEERVALEALARRAVVKPRAEA